jgi:LPS-assembly protein
MRCLFRLVIYLTGLFALLAQAQVSTEGIRLRIEPEPSVALARLPGKRPVYGRADVIEGSVDERMSLKGKANLRQAGTSLTAEQIDYEHQLDDLHAQGQVRLTKGGTIVQGPELRLKLDSQIGTMDNATIAMPAVGGFGSAKRIEFDGPGKVNLLQAMFTTCRPDEAGWLLQADKLRLDQESEQGQAERARLIFQGAQSPVIPRLSFPLTDSRRSGWLPPTVGITSRTGADLTLPYYVNLATNRDLTLYPRLSLLRGASVGAWGRYLEPKANGEFRVELNPNDLRTGEPRYYWSSLHRFQNLAGWSGQWDVRSVSDDQYLVDYSRNIIGSSIRSIPRAIVASRSLGEGALTLSATTYQNVLDARTSPPYEAVPRIEWRWYRYADGESANWAAQRLDWGGVLDVARFRRPLIDSVEGWRTVINPSVQAPWRQPWGYIRPSLSLHATDYRFAPSEALNRSGFSQAILDQAAVQRVLPQFSIDSGLFLERQVSRVDGLEQTLEPRLFYLYVPYREQRQLPIYDTAVADISYAQLFADNRFIGHDRIADANQLTFALSSRLLRSDTGRELFRAAAALRHHLSEPRLQIAGQPQLTDPQSDLLMVASGKPFSAWNLDGGVQVGLTRGNLARAFLGARYQPDESRLGNLQLRFIENQVGQIDASWRWPISGSWSLLGRSNYSFQRKVLNPVSLQTVDARPGVIEGLFGAERKADCWAFRTVLQRYVTGPDLTNTAIFVQLELNGFGGIGNNPFDILRRGIPGYTRERERIPDSPFFAYE